MRNINSSLKRTANERIEKVKYKCTGKMKNYRKVHKAYNEICKMYINELFFLNLKKIISTVDFYVVKVSHQI
jgi:hypothetical protein